MPTYPAVMYEPFKDLPWRVGPCRFRRKFCCPNADCAAVRGKGPRPIGRQTAVERLDPLAGYAVIGHAIERIELAGEVINLPDLPDGTLSFGLPQAARRQTPTPGRPSRIPPHRNNPVLASVGDSHRVGRHDRRRVRGGGTYWHLALSAEKASRPFVVTCPDCRQRCRVDGSPSVDELTGLSRAVRKGLGPVV